MSSVVKISCAYVRASLTASILFLTATFIGILPNVHAQTNGVAAVGSFVDTNAVIDLQLNYYLFLERIQQPWNCFFTGAGGSMDGKPYAAGLGWVDYKGPEVLKKLASPPYQYQVTMYVGADIDSAYYAALNGCAAFEPISLDHNNHAYSDLRDNGEMLGNGPPTWIGVSSGFSTSTQSELRYGPQLEFIDAIDDITTSAPNLAMSFCASCTAARYANLKYGRPDWNVFDLRQGLRQASTFYNPNGWGWREDGGYGFPLVSNAVGDNITAAFVPTNRADLDAGPPLQPAAMGKAGPNGPRVSFRWYNFRQSTFDHTRIRIGTNIIDAPSTALRYDWDVATWPPSATNAEFFTVLTGASQRTSPPEAYTQVALPVVLAQPQFNSDQEFQFNVYAFPGTNTPDPSVRVYASTDLVSWTFLDFFWLPDGKGTFRDTQISGMNCRFYRILQADLHSQTIGFTRLSVAPNSKALIANQLDNGDNSVATIFHSSTITAPITITKQNPTDSASYDLAAQSWTNGALTLSSGEAAWLYNPGTNACIVRFIGEIREGGLLNSVSNNSPILSFMLPIPFSSYARYQRNVFDDPLALGATVQRWNGNTFVAYYNDPTKFAWTPQTPPIQPGEGFTITPGFVVPVDQPVPWAMAFSAQAEADGYIDPLRITNLQIQNEDVVISFLSSVPHIYRLDYTDDLVTWNRASNDTIGNNDIFTLTNFCGAGRACRFYRIYQVQ